MVDNDINNTILMRTIFHFFPLVILFLSTACGQPSPAPAPTVQVTAIPQAATATPTPPPPILARIAFASERDGNLEIYQFDEGSQRLARLVSHPADDYDPAWSPDGGQVAFVSARDGNPELYLFDLATAQTVRLTRHPAADHSPVWSPDGSQLAFVSERAGRADIFMLELDSGRVRQVTEDIAPDYAPDWSPDGEQFVFISERDGTPHIFLIDVDGGSVQQLTNGGSADVDPVWSPGGAQIAFVSGVDEDSQLYIIDNRGRNRVALTDTRLSKAGPVWASDGKQLFFSALTDGAINWDIFKLDLDTRQTEAVANSLAFDGQVTFVKSDSVSEQPWFGLISLWRESDDDQQPDALAVSYLSTEEQVYFSFDYGGLTVGQPWRQVWRHESGLEIVQAGFWEGASGGSAKLVFTLPEQPRLGIWQLNLFFGDQLVQTISFEVHAPLVGQAVYAVDGDLFVIGLDGSGAVQIIDTPEIESQPALSPDGQQVAFVRGGGVFVFNLEDESVVQLTDLGRYAFAPAWSPDGARLAFWMAQDTDWAVYLVNQVGDGLQQLIGNFERPTPLIWQPDGKMLALRDIEDQIVQVDVLTGAFSVVSLPALHWSPDGRTAVFAQAGDIWLHLDELTPPVNLMDHPSIDQFIAWDAHSQNIVLASDRSGVWQLYLFNLKRGTIRQITVGAGIN